MVSIPIPVIFQATWRVLHLIVYLVTPPHDYRSRGILSSCRHVPLTCYLNCFVSIKLDLDQLIG